LSKFTQDDQRRRREMDTGWTVNTTPVRDSIISPPRSVPVADPQTSASLALTAIDAAIAIHGPHSDALGMHLQEARLQLHATLQALSPT